jgi:hypothetical protein
VLIGDQAGIAPRRFGTSRGGGDFAGKDGGADQGQSEAQRGAPESVEPHDHVILPPAIGCAEPWAVRGCFDRHFILTVECSTSHFQSGSVSETEQPPPGGGALSCMEVPFHLCTSARPSQKEKPQALLWDVAG